uniref:RNA polymerase II-associated factor 1 homolog n=1 Tax=Caenorhabditis japonica TaxID=281687 RepID=A0A8R1I151_CAEJA
MAQNSSGAKRIEPPRKVDFVLKPRFSNNVPDVPFDAKFMPCPFVPLQRFVEYKESNIEKDYKHAVICDDDMGLNVDLIDLQKYDEDTEETPLDEKDQFLLEDESTSKMSLKRSAQHSKLVPWMRKTEYISTEFNRFGVTADRQETKLGYNLKKNQQVEDMYRDKQSQIDAINKTFVDVKKPIKEHYSKKGVKALEECYIFPDFKQWKHQFMHVQFDGDTITSGLLGPAKKQAQESSVLRPMEFGDEKFAALFVPTLDCLSHMMEDLEMDRPFDADQKYEFLLSREYTWKAEKVPPRDRDVFALYYRENRFQYNEIDSNVKMARKRKMYLSKKSKLTLTYRAFNEQETAEHVKKDTDLYVQPKARKLEELAKKEALKKVQEEEEGASSADSSDSDKPKKKSSDSDDSSDDEPVRKPRSPASSDEESD